MEAKKKKALLILGVAGLASIIVSLFLGIIIITFFPLLVTFILILLGMLCKWLVEWCVKNIHVFKLREKGEKVKDKLKIDKGINAVKESYQILKEDKVKNSRS
jgi:hypothetical protein